MGAKKQVTSGIPGRRRWGGGQEEGRVHKKLQQGLQNGSKEISPSSNLQLMFLVATTPNIQVSRATPKDLRSREVLLVENKFIASLPNVPKEKENNISLATIREPKIAAQ